MLTNIHSLWQSGAHIIDLASCQSCASFQLSGLGLVLPPLLLLTHLIQWIGGRPYG